MTKQIIGTGVVANDGTGDTLRSGGRKINDNFAELYGALGLSGGIPTLVNQINAGEGISVNATSGVVTVTNTLPNRGSFNTIVTSGGSPVTTHLVQDTLTLAAGGNIQITTDPATKTITIASTNFPPPPNSITQGIYTVSVVNDGSLQLSSTNLVKSNNGASWQFANDGTLILPNGQLDYNSPYARFKSTSIATGAGVQLGSPDDQNYVNVDNTAVTIQVNSDGTGGPHVLPQYNWVFGNNGTLTVPSNIISPASTDLVLGSNNNSHLWKFKSDGTTTFNNVYTFPAADGATDQYLSTNGSGTVSWTSFSLSVFNLGTGVATFLTTPSSANLLAAVTDESGSGKLLFSTSPQITTSVTTDSTSFSLINSTATTVNFAGAATSIGIGASTGTITLGNPTLTGTTLSTFNMNGTSPISISTLTTSSTANVFNANVTTGNLFGAATAIGIGASTGTITLGNPTLTGTTLSTFNMNGTSPINIATTTASSTAGIFNTNVTTANVLGDATAINIGAAASTTTFGKATGNNIVNINGNGTTGIATLGSNVTTGTINVFTSGQTISIGASTGTTTVNNKLSVTGIASSPNFVSGLTNTTSSAGTNTLTLTSNAYQNISGSQAHSFQLPDATTLSNGHTFTVNNNNTSGNISVKNNSGTQIASVIPGANKVITLYNNGSSDGSWDLHGYIPANASWGTSSFDSNATSFTALETPTTLTIGGAATILGIGASTGTLTISNPTITGSNATTLNLNGTSPISISTSTTSSTVNVFNTNATTGNLFGAATTINIGAANSTITFGDTGNTTVKINGASTGGTATLGSNVTTGTISVFTGGQLISIGASTGSTTVNNNLIHASTVTMNPVSANISMQPTGTGTITIKPAVIGTIDNMTIGATTAAAGSFTSITLAGSVLNFTDVYNLDDISFSNDGFTNYFPITYNQTPVAFPTYTQNTYSYANPYSIEVYIDGLKQPAFEKDYDVVWGNNALCAAKGYTVFNDSTSYQGSVVTQGYLIFADCPTAGSHIEVRTLTYVPTTHTPKVYPFKPVDILMGF